MTTAAPRHPQTIALALVSHTNAGKTTLARTFLGRDIGEVRDAPHVTEFAEQHTMIESVDGDRLVLWDTPGFGDSVRLVKRLRAAERPIVRFLAEAWDRWRDRPFWARQQAARTLHDDADAMLYLVDASQSPEAAPYVAAEMELLGWIGKPAIVLLNQLGAAGASGSHGDDADAARWRRALAGVPIVRAVLPLDAFARCWVQELTLLAAVETALPEARRPAMARLRAAWRARGEATFAAAMHAIATSVAAVALTTETIAPDADLRSTLRRVAGAIGRGLGRGDGDAATTTPTAAAQRALVERLADAVRADTTALIRLHGLGGNAERALAAQFSQGVEERLHVDEGKAAAWGGAVTGALMGLKADVLSGGLTLGGGLLTGGLLGALGGVGVARGINRVRGSDRSFVAWKAETLDAVVVDALLRYLAVAHFGRGRGDWRAGEPPAHWRAAVETALAPWHDTFATAWAERELGSGASGGVDDADAVALAAAIEPALRSAAWAALRALYPEADIAVEAPERRDNGERVDVADGERMEPVHGATGRDGVAPLHPSDRDDRTETRTP